MKALAIAANDLRRFLRAPIAVALGLVLPLLLVFITGAGNSRASASVALVVEDDGPMAQTLADSIRSIDALAVLDDDRSSMLRAVGRSDVAAGVVIPAGFDQALRSGGTADVEYLTAAATDIDVTGLIDAEVAALSAQVRAARLAAAETGASFDDALSTAQAVAETSSATEIQLVGPGGEEPEDPVGAFDDAAVSNTLLFVFITAIASSAMIIEARQLGVGRRMLSTPTSATTVVGGATLGRFLISLVQALIIVVVSTILFSVDWGNVPGALAVLALFSLVGAAAGLLGGSVFTGEPMAYGVGIGVGIALIYAALIESIKFISPHYWAWNAVDELMANRGTIGDILPQLGVLALFSVVLLGLSTWRFRAAITS